MKNKILTAFTLLTGIMSLYCQEYYLAAFCFIAGALLWVFTKNRREVKI